MTSRFSRLIALAVLCAAPAAARVNMMEPWSPGMDFRIPKNTWNHDAHLALAFGQHDQDLFALGYILTTPLSPDWEVGGGINFLNISRPSPADDGSGLGDLSIGAKYKVPKGIFPPAVETIGEAGLTLPTGDPDKGLGIGGMGVFFGGGLQGALADEVTAYGHLGYRVNMKGQDFDYGDVFSYTFGIKYRVDAELIVAADVRGFNHGWDKFMGFKFAKLEESYLAPGVIFRPKGKPAEFLGSLLIGLSSDAYDFAIQGSAKF